MPVIGFAPALTVLLLLGSARTALVGVALLGVYGLVKRADETRQVGR